MPVCLSVYPKKTIFRAKHPTGAVFVDLTAAYDTVWHSGLTCKLLRILPDRHIVSFIMKLVRNRSFTLTTGNGAQSRLRRLKNGVPQGSVLAPLFFSIYTHDPPVTAGCQEVCLRRRPGHHALGHYDDQAIMHFAEDWQSLEGTLTQDMATLSSYLQKWKLKVSDTKTVTAAFHLYNKEATRELKIAAEGRILLFSAEPIYLGVTLDRSLTYRRHLKSPRKKLTSRVGLLRCLAGSIWGAGARTLRIAATLALIHSAAEYCAPVWS